MNSSVWAVWAELAVRKKVDLSFFGRLLRVFFFNFLRAKKIEFFWKHCRKLPHFFGNFDDFVYCWTFEILHLHICLLLNLWTFFTAEPLRLSVAAEPLDFLYCWTFEVMPWIMYLFTAEPLRLSVCFWTFGFSLLLNLWIFFTAEHLRLCPGLCICLMLKLWERSAVNKITKNVDP